MEASDDVTVTERLDCSALFQHSGLTGCFPAAGTTRCTFTADILQAGLWFLLIQTVAAVTEPGQPGSAERSTELRVHRVSE